MRWLWRLRIQNIAKQTTSRPSIGTNKAAVVSKQTLPQFCGGSFFYCTYPRCLCNTLVRLVCRAGVATSSGHAEHDALLKLRAQLRFTRERRYIWIAIITPGRRQSRRDRSKLPFIVLNHFPETAPTTKREFSPEKNGLANNNVRRPSSWGRHYAERAPSIAGAKRRRSMWAHIITLFLLQVSSRTFSFFIYCNALLSSCVVLRARETLSAALIKHASRWGGRDRAELVMWLFRAFRGWRKALGNGLGSCRGCQLTVSCHGG